MKCYIRRYDKEKQIFKDGYFSRHIGENDNHWVVLKQEAKRFDSVKEAREFMKTYKLKNCEVEK